MTTRETSMVPAESLLSREAFRANVTVLDARRALKKVSELSPRQQAFVFAFGRLREEERRALVCSIVGVGGSAC